MFCVGFHLDAVAFLVLFMGSPVEAFAVLVFVIGLRFDDFTFLQFCMGFPLDAFAFRLFIGFP